MSVTPPGLSICLSPSIPPHSRRFLGKETGPETEGSGIDWNLWFLTAALVFSAELTHWLTGFQKEGSGLEVNIKSEIVRAGEQMFRKAGYSRKLETGGWMVNPKVRKSWTLCWAETFSLCTDHPIFCATSFFSGHTPPKFIFWCIQFWYL